MERSKQPNAKITVKSRDLRTSNRLAMRTYLEEVDVKTLLDSKNTCEEKVEMLETIVKTGMDILAPKKAKTIHSNDPPWMNSKLKQLIAKRGAVASWLVRSTPDRVVRVRGLAGTLRCVLGQDTLLSRCLSPPRCKIGYRRNAGGNPAMD